MRHPTVRCLDEITLARFLDRSVDTDEAKEVVAHIDVCVDCRRLVSALAASQPGAELDPATGELSAFARAFAPTAMRSRESAAEAAPAGAPGRAEPATPRRSRVAWLAAVLALALALAAVLARVLSR